MRFLRRAVSESMLQGDGCFSEKSRKTEKKNNLRKSSEKVKDTPGEGRFKVFREVPENKPSSCKAWQWMALRR